MIKHCMKKILLLLPPKIAHSIWFFRMHKKVMHWKNPKTYDEKIHWLTVYRLDKGYSKYADKYAVREYIEKCGFKELLVPLYGVWDTLEEIDFSKLPYPNIMKLTHGSGENFYSIMHSSEDKEEVIKKFSKGLKEDFAITNMEYHYHFIKPRIVCEKLLVDGEGKLTDYKVVCSKAL